MNKIKYTFLCITSIYRVHKNVYNSLTRSHKQPHKEVTQYDNICGDHRQTRNINYRWL